MTRLIPTLVSAVVLTACASSGTPGSEMEPFTQTGPPTTITIIVQNRNFADARLYVFRRGARESLGVVGGKTDEEFTLDWSFTDPIQIEIDLVAGPSCRTEELRADPGDILELQIDVVFSQSSACR